MKKRLKGREFPPTPSVSSPDYFGELARDVLEWQQCLCCHRWYEKTDSVPATMVFQGRKREGVICRYCCGSGQTFVELKKIAYKNMD